MLSLAKLANLVGYLLLALGLALSNLQLVFELGPVGTVLGRFGFYLAGFSAAIFIVGLLVLSLGWLARGTRAARAAAPAMPVT